MAAAEGYLPRAHTVVDDGNAAALPNVAALEDSGSRESIRDSSGDSHRNLAVDLYGLVVVVVVVDTHHSGTWEVGGDHEKMMMESCSRGSHSHFHFEATVGSDRVLDTHDDSRDVVAATVLHDSTKLVACDPNPAPSRR